MKYQKYQLADYDAGERGEREPWRSLANSWRSLSNCFPFRGQVRARPGANEIGKLWHKKSTTWPGTAGLFTYGASFADVVEPGYVTFDLGGGRTVTDTGANGILYEGATPVGTINYATGAWTITVGVAFPADIQSAWRSYEALPVTGLFEFTDNDGVRYFMATDTRRLFQWQTVHWVDVGAGDIFSGTEDDLVWFCPFENILVLTNNVDPPKKYTPAGGLGTVADMGTNFDGAPGNDIDKALIILNHKGRLLYINVEENGVRYSHRVRRTQPNNPEAFYDALDYSDAPTGEAILSAGIVSDTVVCLCENNQTYAHRYRGDPLFLYDWVQISRENGSTAVHTTISVEGGLVVLGEFALLSCDGRSLQRIDKAIPTWVRDNLDRNKLEPAFGARYWEFDQAWLSVFRTDEDHKSLLVLDMDKGAYAEFDFDFWVYATARSDTLSALVWDSLPALPWDDPEFDVPWDAYGDAAAVALRSMFAGSRDGIVYLISRNLTSDDNVPYEVSGVTQRLNPFIEQGSDVSLGWVDFQFTRHDGYTVTIDLYQDFEDTSPYESVSVDLTGSGAARTVRRRVPSNCVAQFHSIGFRTLAPGFCIDAIELYCAPARRMVETEVPA